MKKISCAAVLFAMTLSSWIACADEITGNVTIDTEYGAQIMITGPAADHMFGKLKEKNIRPKIISVLRRPNDPDPGEVDVYQEREQNPRLECTRWTFKLKAQETSCEFKASAIK